MLGPQPVITLPPYKEPVFASKDFDSLSHLRDLRAQELGELLPALRRQVLPRRGQLLGGDQQHVQPQRHRVAGVDQLQDVDVEVGEEVRPVGARDVDDLGC